MATKEELLLRALNTTNMADHIHEDLSDLITMVTPKDVPLFARLGRTKATALLHEWTETELGTGFAAAKYADGGKPTDNTHTHKRKGNAVMSVGRVAKATNLLRATNMVGQVDALTRELEEKMIDLLRVIEYYIYNGDKSVTNPQEMNGLLAEIEAASGSPVVINGDVKLAEDKLQEAIVKCYNNGGAPNLILARPEVAYRIANFTANKIRYGAGGEAGGVGATALRYLSPFGTALDVVPVRADFLPSGNVLVLDESKIKLAFLSNGIEVLDLARANDAEEKLIKAYLTLEVRAASHHAKITGVLD